MKIFATVLFAILAIDLAIGAPVINYAFGYYIPIGFPVSPGNDSSPPNYELEPLPNNEVSTSTINPNVVPTTEKSDKTDPPIPEEVTTAPPNVVPPSDSGTEAPESDPTNPEPSENDVPVDKGKTDADGATPENPEDLPSEPPAEEATKDEDAAIHDLM